MSDWHSIIYQYEPIFGMDNALEKYKTDGEWCRTMKFEDGHFSSAEENCTWITDKYPDIVFKGIVYEYSNGGHSYWEILFSHDEGIFYHGLTYSIDLSCARFDIETDNARICGLRILDNESLEWTDKKYYPELEHSEINMCSKQY